MANDTDTAYNPVAATALESDPAAAAAAVASTETTATTATTAPDDGYIQTTTHNYVSRLAVIQGSQQVELKGRSVVANHVQIRGDLAIIRMGRYCFLHERTTIEPPPMPGGSSSPSTSRTKYIPVSIGSHTVIGRDCLIQAAAVGSSCWIEPHVTLGPRCIVKDCSVVTRGTIVPADTVVPPYTRASMCGRRFVTQPLPPSMAVELQEKAVEAFAEFVQHQTAAKSGPL